ncbi:MAG TPA: thermonuclease family protein [Thermoleophilaceae bacterium]|nr:thermonuclease family protein [Thermoleophilaceae bacterium]
MLLVLALAAVLAVLLLSGGKHRSGERAAGNPARVVRVVDGDTFVASAGGRTFYVRLLGIDTPETHRPGTPVECGGPEASANMRALIASGARVRLETDPGQDSIDRYGRLLAYVWLSDGRLLEQAQLESGWANTYVFEGRPVSLFPRLAAAAREARDAGRGAWLRCGGDFHSASR